MMHCINLNFFHKKEVGFFISILESVISWRCRGKKKNFWAGQ